VKTILAFEVTKNETLLNYFASWLTKIATLETSVYSTNLKYLTR